AFSCGNYTPRERGIDLASVFYFPLLGTPTALGNKLSFYVAGTTTPLDVWTDSDLTIPWAQPIIFNATGNPDGPIYLTLDISYKVVYTDANDVAIPGYPVDMVDPTEALILNVPTTSRLTIADAAIKTLPTTAVDFVLQTDPTSGQRVRPLGLTIVTRF